MAPAGLETRPASEEVRESTLSRRLIVISAAGLVVLSAALKLWAARQWSWFQDDWSYIERTVDLSFWDYVTQDYNGHFMPLQFALVWAISVISPLDYGLAILVSMSVIVAGLVGWCLALLKIFGARPQVLVGLAVVGFSPLLVQPTLWWASALQTYSLIGGMGWVLYWLWSYQMSGGTVRYVGVLAVYAASLLMWQKNLLIAIPAFFIIAWVGFDRRLPSDVRRRSWIVSAGIAAVTIGYVAAFLYFTREVVPGDAQLGLPGVEPLAGFALTAGLGILLPAAIGGTWQSVESIQGAFPMAATWIQWSLGLAAVAIAVLAVALRRRAAWVILMVLVYAIAAWALVVGSTRFGSLGQFASLDARYSADIIPVLAMGFVFLSTATVEERRTDRAWIFPIPRAAAHIWQFTCGVLTIVIVCSSLVTWSLQLDALGKHSPRSWVDNLIASAKGAGSASVFNSNAPDNVVFPAFLPSDARLARMLAPLGLPLEFDAPGERLLAADDRGQLVPATIRYQTQAVQGGTPDCGYLVNGEQWTFVPLEGPLYAWNWGVEFAYFAENPVTFEVRAPHDGFVFRAPAGLDEVQGVLVSEVDTVAIRLAEPGVACVTSMGIGLVEASSQ